MKFNNIDAAIRAAKQIIGSDASLEVHFKEGSPIHIESADDLGEYDEDVITHVMIEDSKGVALEATQYGGLHHVRGTPDDEQAATLEGYEDDS